MPPSPSSPDPEPDPERGTTAGPLPPSLAEIEAETAAARALPAVSLSQELLDRARIARDQYDGHPPARWSSGEQAAVALLLGSRTTLQRLEMSPEQACLQLADDIDLEPHEAATWVEHQRQTLTKERS